MRYTLQSRYRGTIAGATLGLFVQESASFDIVQACKHAALSSKSIILHGKFNAVDLNVCSHQQAFLDTLFSALPVALFFHDNLLKLRHNLLQVAGTYSDNLIIRDSILAIGYTIAQSLNEKLCPSELLSEVIRFIGETPTNVPQQLQSVNNLLTQQLSLKQSCSELYKVKTISNLVATAFYTFLKSLEDFRLSVTLSLSNAFDANNHDYYILGSMTGALSGAYNSANGIPISWQIKYLHSKISKTAENEFLQTLRLTDELLATWSGVYQPECQEIDPYNYLPLLKDNPNLCVFAAPSIIRLPNLKQ